jgi:hypothetical protein
MKQTFALRERSNSIQRGILDVITEYSFYDGLQKIGEDIVYSEGTYTPASPTLKFIADMNIEEIECSLCHLKPSFFALERIHDQVRYLLYGTTPEGLSVHFDVDHELPLSAGGNNHVSNYQLTCHACNFSKGDKQHFHLDKTKGAR